MGTNNTLRIISLDEIAAREDAIWDEHFGLFNLSSKLSPRTRRQLRTCWKAYEAITFGFAPLAWDTNYGGVPGFTDAHRAVCLECGHVVATQQPSWMRKHAADKHGRERSMFQSELRDAAGIPFGSFR